MINVDFRPARRTTSQGVRVTRQGERNLGFVRSTEPPRRPRNPVLSGSVSTRGQIDVPAESISRRWRSRYVSVTPLRLDRTDEAFSEALDGQR